MNHFLEIAHLSRIQIEDLIQRALIFKKQKHFPAYSQHRVANLFYENSTRTRVSFELAARNLSLAVFNLDMAHSSEAKGECIEDTVKNLAAMGIDYFVVRHQREGLPEHLTEIASSIHVINAGDGMHAHPSQALLDLLTIYEQKPDLERLKIAILGDIKHSRVANSLQAICQKFKIGELVFVAPPVWQPLSPSYGRVTQNINEGLSEADVIICLRVQKERLLATEELDLKTYRCDFALTATKLLRAKKDVIVMHPGPLNRGLEIDDEVADGPQSFILQQVTNGVFARMAVFDALIDH